MKSVIKNTLLFIALSLCLSCEKEININVRPYDSQLVINSITLVGDSIQVAVTRSADMKTYNKNKDLNVTNAEVILYAGSAPVDTLHYNVATRSYISYVKAIEGISYMIKANAAGFTGVTAVSESPVFVPIKSCRHYKNTRLNDEGQTQDEIRVIFDDPSVRGDYYILKISSRDNYTDTTQILGCINTMDVGVETIYDEDVDQNTCLDPNGIFFRDQLFNGVSREMRFFIQSKYLEGLANSTLTVQLQHVSEAFFRYQKSYMFLSENSGNPFSEPMNVYSNVTNGFGIFSIVNSDVQQIN